MINHQSRESIKLSESIVDPENADELKRTKTDIDNNITKILKLIKNENQTKKTGNTKRSRKEAELVGLTEDLYKQSQSLYALYDHVIEKVVSHRRNRKASVSSSDSDLEFFSSEEVDDNTNEVLKSEAMESDGQLTSLMQEMRSLSQQKRDLELQVESQANEAKQMSVKNTELQDQVKELKLLLKEKQGVVSNLEEKLNNSEDQARSNIVKLMAQISEIKRETESLRTQTNETKEKLKFDKNEASTQRENLMEQLNVMQQQLDSLGNHNKELEAQMERKGKQISQYMSEIENLKENLAETRSTELTMKEEKEGFFARIKDLELELVTRSNQKSELEEQLRDTSYEVKHLRSTEQTMKEEKEGFFARIKDLELELETRGYQNSELEKQLRDTSYEVKHMMNENKALQDRNHELKAAPTQRGEEISGFLRENESHKYGASMEAMTLKAEVNAMRLELDTLQEQKTKLELQNERNQKEYAESIAKMEILNTKLETQISDQEKTIKDQIATIDRMSAEQKQTAIMSNKLKLNQRYTERKMEELAEEFRKNMEDNIRLLHQRIHVAEQLNNENKTSCRITKQEYEEENRILGEKVISYEEELLMLKGGAELDSKGFEIEFEAALNRLDVAAANAEKQRECVQKSVSNMLCDVQFAKDWIKKRNEEMKKMKDNLDSLMVLLSEKEEQELVLRDKVWNLEAEVSKGGGENLNLTNAVSQLEKKVGKLEKNLKEKDEDFVSLGEKKREAIRQLCLVVEFHRDRCNYLRNLVTNMKVNKKT